MMAHRFISCPTKHFPCTLTLINANNVCALPYRSLRKLFIRTGRILEQ